MGSHLIDIYLYESLECVVLGKCDNFEDLAHPAENLKDHVQGHRVHHVLNNHTQHCVGTWKSIKKALL